MESLRPLDFGAGSGSPETDPFQLIVEYRLSIGYWDKRREWSATGTTEGSSPTDFLVVSNQHRDLREAIMRTVEGLKAPQLVLELEED